jgi:hypothetical protein
MLPKAQLSGIIAEEMSVVVVVLFGIVKIMVRCF